MSANVRAGKKIVLGLHQAPGKNANRLKYRAERWARNNLDTPDKSRFSEGARSVSEEFLASLADASGSERLLLGASNLQQFATKNVGS